LATHFLKGKGDKRNTFKKRGHSKAFSLICVFSEDNRVPHLLQGGERSINNCNTSGKQWEALSEAQPAKRV
jgi:hypothetical protein